MRTELNHRIKYEDKLRLVDLGNSFPILYEFLRDDLRDDEELLLKFIKIYNHSYWAASERLRANPEIYLLAIGSPIDEEGLYGYTKFWERYIPSSIKNDLSTQLRALHLDPFAPMLAATKVRENPEYIIALANKYGVEHMAACLPYKLRKKYGSPEEFNSEIFNLSEEQAQKLYEILVAELEKKSLELKTPQGKPSTRSKDKI